MRRQIILIGLIGLIGLNLGTAQVAIGPRSVGTAGTFATQSRGDNAIGWNPANLGLADNPRFGLRFGVLPLVPYPSVQLNNDVVTMNWFGEWFTKGDYLDARDISDLLDAFPSDGVHFSPLISMKLVGMNFGHFAVSLTPELHTSITLPKGLFEFALKGNEFDDPIRLDDLNIQVQAALPISFAYGMQVDIPVLTELVKATYVGGAIKLIAGAVYVGTDHFDGQITSYKDRIHLQGDLSGKYAGGGFGTAFDLGAAVDLTDNIRVNAALNNLFGFVSWIDTYAEEFTISFDGEILAADFEDFGDFTDEQVDSAFNVIDTTIAIDGFSTRYPAYLLFGFEYRGLLPALDVYVNYRQDLSEEYYFDLTPRISAAAEYRIIPWLPLRGGLAIGGFEEFQWGIGFGLHFEHYQMDIGFSQDGGL
ncbi:MAG: DUF5723 family protein, partial [Candidatus Neomarinimicrobiota bacterium]